MNGIRVSPEEARPGPPREESAGPQGGPPRAGSGPAESSRRTGGGPGGSPKKSRRSWESNGSGTEERVDGRRGTTESQRRDRPGVHGLVDPTGDVLPVAKAQGGRLGNAAPGGPSPASGELCPCSTTSGLPPAQGYATLLDEGKYLLFDPHPVSGAPGERTGPRATPSASPSPLSGTGTVGHPPRSKVRPHGPTSLATGSDGWRRSGNRRPWPIP